MPTSYAIVGASRGIGLEFVRQLSARPNTTVYAVVRNPTSSTFLNEAVKGLKNVHIITGDVEVPESMRGAAEAVGKLSGGKLDCIIHNAAKMDLASMMKGFDSYGSLEEMDEAMIDMFRINSLGPIHTIATFLPLLRAGSAKKIVVIGSEGGTTDFIKFLRVDDMASYGMTKAAQHIATTKYAMKLAPEGFTVVSVSPGLVDTTSTMPESEKNLPEPPEVARLMANAKAKGLPAGAQLPQSAVSKMLRAVDRLSPSQNGEFLSPTMNPLKVLPQIMMNRAAMLVGRK
ncbi:NAD-P-binding protein [Epithele typhae]|uniref:NAD-P-binding protein n=1 Tax=Epithele typhae TaxID=378194 RepID=UPI0020084D36|nr:NAD-P-binding protein [Epithele typhae]KAH9926561.1 NAD-P-binding protein [Epithele typhae]